MCPKAIRNDIPKPCTKCGVVQPPENFYANPTRPGKMSVCRGCTRKKSRETYQKAKAKGTHSAAQRKSHIKRTYGLSLEDYQSILLSQGGVCAICQKDFGRTGPSVDHDHLTGRVRGLLCRRCNSGIGMLDDSIDLVLRAASYLERFQDGAF